MSIQVDDVNDHPKIAIKLASAQSISFWRVKILINNNRVRRAPLSPGGRGVGGEGEG